MIDFLRESFSYFGLYRAMAKIQKLVTPQRVPFGDDPNQYFNYYEPLEIKSDKIIFWVHGGGWNAGDPAYFDFVGQCFAREGYRAISAGYRLSPKNKYPCQIEDVCNCYNNALEYLRAKGIDTSKIVVAGPSAGAHLTSIFCYSQTDQKKYGVDITPIIGFIGSGGPYAFDKNVSWTLKILLGQLFAKNYDRSQGEPVKLMGKNHIPMLLIQSHHDGLIDYGAAEKLAARAAELGNRCELYAVEDAKNTHSWFTAGMFLMSRAENKGLDKFFSWIEALSV